jgi:hypothetical protein
MGIGVIIHGHISATGHGNQVECQRIHEHNSRVINSLPDSDEEWPFFPRSMFTVAPLRRSLEQCIPQYENQTIQLLGDFKNEYALSTQWVQKFERLLSRLCWDHAVVYTEFAMIRYEWSVDNDLNKKLFFSDPPQPPTEWTLKASRIGDEEMELSSAIDGGYSPINPKGEQGGYGDAEEAV